MGQNRARFVLNKEQLVQLNNSAIHQLISNNQVGDGAKQFEKDNVRNVLRIGGVCPSDEKDAKTCLLAANFTENEAELILSHYNQRPAYVVGTALKTVSDFQILAGSTSDFGGDNPPELDYTVNVYKDASTNKLFYETTGKKFTIKYMDAANKLQIIGPFEAESTVRYEFTNKGLELVQIETDSAIIHNLLIKKNPYYQWLKPQLINFVREVQEPMLTAAEAYTAQLKKKMEEELQEKYPHIYKRHTLDATIINEAGRFQITSTTFNHDHFVNSIDADEKKWIQQDKAFSLTIDAYKAIREVRNTLCLKPSECNIGKKIKQCEATLRKNEAAINADGDKAGATFLKVAKTILKSAVTLFAVLGDIVTVGKFKLFSTLWKPTEGEKFYKTAKSTLKQKRKVAEETMAEAIAKRPRA